MLCCDEFSRFLQVLESSENTFEISGLAIEQIAGKLGIGKVSSNFCLAPTSTTPHGQREDIVLFSKVGVVTGEPCYEKSYRTAEGALVVYSVWQDGSASRLWTEEDLKDIDTVLDLVYLHNGRFRLIGKMKEIVMTNYLTGLPNSGGFITRLRKHFEDGNLADYAGFCFNLKGFGLTNRRFGKREGDNILKRYAKFLDGFVEEDEILSHFGGDNFAALIQKGRVQEFLNILSGTVIYGTIEGRRVPVRVEAVAGVMMIEDSLQSPGQVVDCCQLALQLAKNHMNKPYLFATDEMRAKILWEKQISSHFRDALQNNEFVIYYQPKVDTKTYTLIGAEALVRWYWDGKIVSPADFIPLVEREGTVTELDLYVLEQTCTDIKDWLRRGFEPVTVSVNFSRRDISDPLLAQKIVNIIDHSGIDRKYIQIEVTETTSEEETAKLIQFLNLMHNMNIETAIDDFGSGYSSLNTLRNFMVNVIKIDRSFISNDCITQKDEIVLHNIVDMAKELDIKVVTEGVEHLNQLQLLQKIGCYTIQGFLFDRPMPRFEFEERLEKKKYDRKLLNEAN